MTAETIYYAIGDVHGMAKSLEALYGQIAKAGPPKGFARAA